ncbi:MAG: hypothetical protein C4318_00615 [Acidimicrobiia bacterium]
MVRPKIVASDHTAVTKPANMKNKVLLRFIGWLCGGLVASADVVIPDNSNSCCRGLDEGFFIANGFELPLPALTQASKLPLRTASPTPSMISGTRRSIPNIECQPLLR